MRLMAGTAQVEGALAHLKALFPGRRDELDAVAGKAKLGLQIDVTPIRRRHSREQQGAYWACLTELGRELGYEKHEVEPLLHPVICAAAFGVKDHRSIRCRGQDYQWPVPAETSSKDADGKVRDAETYALLIDTLLRFGAEYGVVLEVKSA